MTYYLLRGLAEVGLIWDLHGVPEHIAEPEPKTEGPGLAPGPGTDAVPDVA